MDIVAPSSGPKTEELRLRRREEETQILRVKCVGGIGFVAE